MGLAGIVDVINFFYLLQIFVFFLPLFLDFLIVYLITFHIGIIKKSIGCFIPRAAGHIPSIYCKVFISICHHSLEKVFVCVLMLRFKAISTGTPAKEFSDLLIDNATFIRASTTSGFLFFTLSSSNAQYVIHRW